MKLPGGIKISDNREKRCIGTAFPYKKAARMGGLLFEFSLN